MDLWQQRLGADGRPQGLPRPVTIGIGMRRAVFSRDGKKLAYSRGRLVANLWRVPIRADEPATWSDAQQVTFDEAFIEFVDVSPDGRRLVFDSDRGGDKDLWMMPLDGDGLLQLTADPGPDWAPRWSGDGEKIAFYTARTGNRDIWVMPARGGPVRQITRDPADDLRPVWSPDGREIAFDAGRGGNQDIWVTPAEGGEARQITDDPATDRRPQWSPDGKSLLFISNRSGEDRLWRLPVTGGPAEMVSRRFASYARWSSDGTTVYFVGAGESGPSLWAVSVDDGSERSLTQLADRRGALGAVALAAHGQDLFFAWEEDFADLWIMQVAD